MNKILKFIRHPKELFIGFMTNTAAIWPDKLYLRIIYFLCIGKQLNLNHPKTFMEKINWMKVNDFHPEYSRLVDKYEVKSFVKEKLKSDENIIKTLGVWRTFDEIDFSSLPEKFVLKTTNGGGNTSVVICQDKSNFNIKDARNKLTLRNGKKVFMSTREYPYYSVPPRIIAEEYIEAPNNELSDYKFFCFDGEPKFLYVGTERQNAGEDVKFDFYDINFNHLTIENGHQNARIAPEKPNNFEEMLEIAKKLSQGIPHVRVDLYNVNGKIYFGELTFFHMGGLVPFKPAEWDERFGEYLKLKGNSNH